MGILLEIPDAVTQAMRLPPADLQRELLIELALALYSRSVLSFGKARELASMNKYDFGILLGKRGIVRQYNEIDLRDDIVYARRQ